MTDIFGIFVIPYNSIKILWMLVTSSPSSFNVVEKSGGLWFSFLFSLGSYLALIYPNSYKFYFSTKPPHSTGTWRCGSLLLGPQEALLVEDANRLCSCPLLTWSALFFHCVQLSHLGLLLCLRGVSWMRLQSTYPQNSRKNPQFQPNSLIWLCILFWSVLPGFYWIFNFGNCYSHLKTVFSDLRLFHFHTYSILLTLLNEFFIWFRFSDSSESIWFRNFLKCSIS